MSLRTADPQRAEFLRRQLDARLAAPPDSVPEGQTFTLAEAVAAFLKHQHGLAPRTRAWYGEALNRFTAWVGAGTFLRSLTSDDLLMYREYRHTTVAAATVAADLRAVRAFLNWCVERRWIDESPCTPRITRVPGIRARAPVALSPEQLLLYERRLAGTVVYRVLMFGAYAGLRINEMLHLERADVQPYERPPYHQKIVLQNKDHLGFELKSHRAREIPVEPELEQVLPMFGDGLLVPSPEGHRWNRGNLIRAWRRELQKAHLPPLNSSGRYGIRVHDLRRTYATLMHEYRGVPLDRLRRRLGHANLRTTQGYLCGTEL